MTTALPMTKTSWRPPCNHPHPQWIYHVSMLHVFFKTRVCQTIYHSTFWKRTISPWSIRLGSDSSISPWSVGCRVCPPHHGLHLRVHVACTNEVWSPNPYLLHLLPVLQLTTSMLLPVRTMHYRRHQKQTAGSRLLLLCPPYCLHWLVTTSSRAKMAARLLPGPGPGRAFQMVTNTHCRPKSLSNFATPPFRPGISPNNLHGISRKRRIFYRVVGSLTDGNILLMKFSSLAALKVVKLTTLSVSMTEMSSKWQNFRFGVGSMRKKVFIIIMCYNPAPKGRIKQEPGLILLRGFYSRRKTLW